jgi:transcriptional regulator with XRE-family HTH domain
MAKKKQADKIQAEFRRALRAARESSGRSPAEVAEVAHVSAGVIEAIENGDRFPPHPGLFRWRAVAEALSVDPADLENRALLAWQEAKLGRVPKGAADDR